MYKRQPIRNAELSETGLTTKDVKDDSRDDCPKFINQSPAHGSHGGGPFVIMPESSCDRIFAVVVKASSTIRKLFLIYKREDGSTYTSAEAGETGGVFFVHVVGHNNVIDQFATTFTNTVKFMRIRTVDKFTNQPVAFFEVGTNSGTHRQYAYGGNQVLGFYGEDGDRVNRLGALVYENNDD